MNWRKIEKETKLIKRKFSGYKKNSLSPGCNNYDFMSPLTDDVDKELSSFVKFNLEMSKSELNHFGFASTKEIQ